MKLQPKYTSRCPFCHENISTGKIYGCQCGALYHVDCCFELTKCVSCDATEGFTADPIERTDAKENIFDVDTFVKAIKSYPKYKAMTALAYANSSGPLYLVGGRVYRTLLLLDAFKVHGADILQGDSFDWDFLCNKTTWFRHFPKECEEEYKVTRYRGYSSYEDTEMRNLFKSKRTNGCYRFTSPTTSMDLMVIKKVVRDKNLPKDLQGYLQSVPLDTQAVAFDITNSKFYYTQSFVQAFQKKRVGVNNHTMLTNHCRYKRIDIHEYMHNKANAIGFTYYYENQPEMVK